jgi:hypothetical protein
MIPGDLSALANCLHQASAECLEVAYRLIDLPYPLGEASLHRGAHRSAAAMLSQDVRDLVQAQSKNPGPRMNRRVLISSWPKSR